MKNKNSIKSDSLRAFQQHQEHNTPKFQYIFSVLILFHWANGSMINSFHTVTSKSLKPSWCTPTHSLRAFQRYQELCMKQCGLGDLNMTNKTKQNKLPCFIDRFENKFQPLFITNSSSFPFIDNWNMDYASR